MGELSDTVAKLVIVTMGAVGGYVVHPHLGLALGILGLAMLLTETGGGTERQTAPDETEDHDETDTDDETPPSHSGIGAKESEGYRPTMVAKNDGGDG